MLYEATNGRLRDIDGVATSALKSEGRRKMTQVDRDLIVEGRRGSSNLSFTTS